MKEKKIRVFHVEDYKIMRDGIKYLLLQDSQIEVVGGAKDSTDLLLALETTEVDVLVLDIFLNRLEDVKSLNGFEICQYVNKKFPHMKIIAHSVYDDADKVEGMLKAGAAGFVSKKSGIEELLLGIKTVSEGERFICPETSKRLKNLNKFLAGMESTLRSRDAIFSQRELEILNLLSEGHSSKEIASKLHITERTVETHRKNMLEKSKVKNTVGLIAYASALGLLKK